ncbi:NAD(P)/FAD-dependent oxidoreductase [Rheinheimera metallidurans]|uniref:NAD(P)/FAD-dependent oxidoreductase n=1 Tax=Rheinheimera metallidurans TaxID=2925781 RepID=UPI00300151B2
MTIAIIGAGIAGAICASELVRNGHKVIVFDKGRSAGGRMSSKRTENGYIDLGAQYFTARSELFSQQCITWQAHGVIMPWQAKLAVYENAELTASPDNIVRYIGQPSMHKPVQQLLQQTQLVLECCVDRIHFDGKHWRLYRDQQPLGSFSQLVLAIPQQQAALLLANVISQFNVLAAAFAAAALQPCWAVNVALHQPSGNNFDGISVKEDAALTWLARQTAKQGRVTTEQWLLHFSPTFSQQQLDTSAEQMALASLSQLQRILGQQLQGTVTHCHRWRYAQQTSDYPIQGYLHHADMALALCGDWLNGGRVENAWLSGYMLAQQLSV